MFKEQCDVILLGTQPKLITMDKEQKRDELLANYVLKGNVLKRVSLDILPKLSGVIDGLAAEVLNDD